MIPSNQQYATNKKHIQLKPFGVVHEDYMRSAYVAQDVLNATIQPVASEGLESCMCIGLQYLGNTTTTKRTVQNAKSQRNCVLDAVETLPTCSKAASPIKP